MTPCDEKIYFPRTIGLSEEESANVFRQLNQKIPLPTLSDKAWPPI